MPLPKSEMSAPATGAPRVSLDPADQPAPVVRAATRHAPRGNDCGSDHRPAEAPAANSTLDLQRDTRPVARLARYQAGPAPVNSGRPNGVVRPSKSLCYKVALPRSSGTRAMAKIHRRDRAARRPGLPSFPGDPPLARGAHPAGWRRALQRGRLSLTTHAGTHVDAPYHFVAGGATVDELPLEILMGKVRVVDCRRASHRARRPRGARPPRRPARAAQDAQIRAACASRPSRKTTST